MEVYVGVQPDGPNQISSSSGDVVELMCVPTYQELDRA